MWYLDDELWGDPLCQVAHAVDDNLGDVVVGGQLDLELDGGGVVLRLAQVVFTPTTQSQGHSKYLAL